MYGGGQMYGAGKNLRNGQHGLRMFSAVLRDSSTSWGAFWRDDTACQGTKELLDDISLSCSLS